ncbi:hypothetical protein J0H58_39135, partial [bacterium]|nr:hypothetical protein [bacterium]
CYTTVAAAGRKADLIAARLAHETVGHIWSEKDGVVKPLKEHVLSNGYLARVALTAIEANQLAARVAALEAVLARRCPS